MGLRRPNNDRRPLRLTASEAYSSYDPPGRRAARRKTERHGDGDLLGCEELAARWHGVKCACGENLVARGLDSTKPGVPAKARATGQLRRLAAVAVGDGLGRSSGTYEHAMAHAELGVRANILLAGPEPVYAAGLDKSSLSKPVRSGYEGHEDGGAQQPTQHYFRRSEAQTHKRQVAEGQTAFAYRVDIADNVREANSVERMVTGLAEAITPRLNMTLP